MWSHHNCLIIVMSSEIHYDIISGMKTEQVRHGDDEQTSSFLSSFMDSLCHVRNKIMYVLSWQTVSAPTQMLFLYLFPSLLRNSGNKHKNNPVMSAETVHYLSTYIILYVSHMKWVQWGVMLHMWVIELG